MADYKAIHGKNIQHLASDLDNAEGEGEIWFNTTSSDYKTIVKVAGAWASGGNLNTARDLGGSLGIQTAAMHFGGRDHSTVIHACRVIKEKMKEKSDLRRRVDGIRSQLEF